MAKAGKFAALAEFRQHPGTEPEPVQVSGDEITAVADPGTKQTSTPTPESEADAAAAAIDYDSDFVEEVKLVRPQQNPGTPARPRGRPPGKRSDPDWKLYSHFLKRSTQRQASAILFEAEDGRDLSDVLQYLLEKWVARRRSKI